MGGMDNPDSCTLAYVASGGPSILEIVKEWTVCSGDGRRCESAQKWCSFPRTHQVIRPQRLTRPD